MFAHRFYCHLEFSSSEEKSNNLITDWQADIEFNAWNRHCPVKGCKIPGCNDGDFFKLLMKIYLTELLVLSPVQTDSQVVASWNLGSTCDSVWPGLACTCVELRWLAITLVEIKFARKSMEVFYRLATQRKSLREFNLLLLATTCESVWPGL